MLGDIGLPELAVIGLVAVLVFGPDRLPDLIRSAVRVVQQVRTFVAATQEQMNAHMDELGIDEDARQTIRDLRSLNPREAMRQHLFDDPSQHSAGTADGPEPLPSAAVTADTPAAPVELAPKTPEASTTVRDTDQGSSGDPSGSIFGSTSADARGGTVPQAKPAGTGAPFDLEAT